jgi:hypothetical protein
MMLQHLAARRSSAGGGSGAARLDARRQRCRW